jgi:beta-glucanase (GH16 family)
MLGNDAPSAGWPACGEIDIMENLGRSPLLVYGTIHGPGYSGSSGFGGVEVLDAPASDGFHVYAVEWQPGRIAWSVDGVVYKVATPSDVAPNQWVFDHPFFLLLNVAVGGNLGGGVGSDAHFPQAMTVDYVRIYQPAP